MSAHPSTLDAYRAEVLSEPPDYWLDEQTGDLFTLPPCAPVDGRFQVVRAVRRRLKREEGREHG